MLNKSNFRDLVGIDHFFMGFKKSEIEDLKAMSKLPFCRFSRVKSGKDSWQGVYWTSATQSYFEMVESPEPGHYQFGLAISANHIQYNDIRRIRSFYKGVKRLSAKVRVFEKSKKWFEYVFKTGPAKSSVSMWAMHYFFCERERKISKNAGPSIIERFTELEIEVNPRFLKELRDTCYWMPFHKNQRGKTLILDFLNKDRSQFRVKCIVNPKVEHSTFLSLKAQASPLKKYALPTMKYFKLSQKKGAVTLERK